MLTSETKKKTNNSKAGESPPPDQHQSLRVAHRRGRLHDWLFQKDLQTTAIGFVPTPQSPTLPAQSRDCRFTSKDTTFEQKQHKLRTVLQARRVVSPRKISQLSEERFSRTIKKKFECLQLWHCRQGQAEPVAQQQQTHTWTIIDSKSKRMKEKKEND